MGGKLESLEGASRHPRSCPLMWHAKLILCTAVIAMYCSYCHVLLWSYRHVLSCTA